MSNAKEIALLVGSIFFPTVWCTNNAAAACTAGTIAADTAITSNTGCDYGWTGGSIDLATDIDSSNIVIDQYPSSPLNRALLNVIGQVGDLTVNQDSSVIAGEIPYRLSPYPYYLSAVTVTSGSSLGSLNNYGSIRGVVGEPIVNYGTIGQINNFAGGEIYGGTEIRDPAYYKSAIDNGGSIGEIYNESLISGNLTIYNTGNIGRIINNGEIFSSEYGSAISNSGTIDTIVNGVDGKIIGGPGGASYEAGIESIYGGTIFSIINLGEITGSLYDINSTTDRANIGTINTLSNLQGSGSAGGALKYNGPLPGNYNGIFEGNSYGQVIFSNSGDSQLTFDVFRGDSSVGVGGSVLNAQTYTDVMVGLSVANIKNKWAQTIIGDHRSFGTYNGMLWMLREHQEDYSWNLEVLNVADNFFAPGVTALNRQMSDLQGKIDMGAGSAYGCDIDPGRIGCLSVKGGYASQGDGSSNGVVAAVGGVRLGQNVEVGGFVEQGFAWQDPNNVEYKSTMPSLGGFLGLNQNEDGTGLRAKTSAAVERGDAKLSRENLLGPAALASGNADLNGYALAQTLGYGIGIDNASVVTPYVGIGYVSSTRDSYKEKSDTSGIDDVFDYSSYSQQSTFGSVGLAYERDNHAGFTLRGGAALTYVFSSEADDLKATSNVPGIETISAKSSFDQTGDLGVTGYLGTDYAITDNQKIGFDASTWRSVSTGDYGYGLMAGWTMVFGGGKEVFDK